MANNANLDGGQFLASVFTKDSVTGHFFQKIIDAVNKVAQAAGVGAVGEISPPPPVEMVNVSTSGETIQVSQTHTAPILRGAHYFTEISANDPHFSQPVITIHQGVSRSPAPFTLPTKDSNGNTISYYVRSYTQYPGSQPSVPTVYGGAGNPLAITMGGTTHMTLLPGAGSGTATSDGKQAGQGFGKIPSRPAPAPLRNVK